MDFYRPTHSASSPHGRGIVYPSLVNEGCALPTCSSPPDVARESLIRRCSSEPIPASEPHSSLAVRVLRLLSIHPTSPGFPLLPLLLDLAIFYLVQAVQLTTGVVLLHALYPSEPEYAVTPVRSMRIGAAGGAMFVGILTLRSLVQLGCSEAEEEDTDSDMPERWESVWDAVGCLQATRAPDARYVAFIGVSGSIAFGRGMDDMSELLHAATAAVVGYVVLCVSRAALLYVERVKVGL